MIEIAAIIFGICALAYYSAGIRKIHHDFRDWEIRKLPHAHNRGLHVLPAALTWPAHSDPDGRPIAGTLAKHGALVFGVVLAAGYFLGGLQFGMLIMAGLLVAYTLPFVLPLPV